MSVPLIWYLWNDQTVINGGNTNVFSITLRQIGSTFLLSFIFLNIYGQPTDPDAPSISISFPDATQFSAVPERVDQGYYTYPVATPLVGDYFYTFSSL